VATPRDQPQPKQASGVAQDPAPPEPPRGALTVSAGRGPVGLSIAFVVVGALILLGGLVLVLVGRGSTSTAAGPPPAYLYVNGWVQRPPALAVGTDARVTSLRWLRWGAATATAGGLLPVNDCQPTCATGTRRPTPATVTASRLRVCSSRRVYTHVAVRVQGQTSAAVPLGFDFSCG
jgi:hypothetical protein